MRLALFVLLSLSACAPPADKSDVSPTEASALDNAAAKLDGPPPTAPPPNGS
jgi:hypothetical protein